jgi:site-specific recombinase XerD
VAAALLAAGADSLEIQRGLGHEKLALTGHYASAFTRWKSQVDDEQWPRGRLCFLAPSEPAAEVAKKD